MAVLRICPVCQFRYDPRRDRTAGCPACNPGQQPLTQEERIANYSPSAYAEYLRLCELKVPASFRPRSSWPDTPADRAARRQRDFAAGRDL